MQPELQTSPVYRAGTQDVALQQQKVLRNTYLLLGLTMVPTVIGAYIGIHTAGIIMQHPIMGFFLMLAAVIGLLPTPRPRFAVRFLAALSVWTG